MFIRKSDLAQSKKLPLFISLGLVPNGMGSYEYL